MEILDVLNWRYATKKYNKQKVSDEKIKKIISAINFSASSLGIQPYRLFLIENNDLRKKLSAASFNPQVQEASHLILFAAFDSIKQESIENYINLIAKVRQMPVEKLIDFKGMLQGLLNNTDQENFIWSSKQAYIGLGTGLIAAASEKVDATPMEGFNAEEFDKLLGLNEKGLKSVVLLALGYRDEENDFLAKLKKVRLPIAEFVLHLK
ncbi:NAD(P)H-dependent oxidoreductase [Flavobacterium sp. J27]|uniref:NAD(P)H-dependent oxidoreductase n=1 Tax=Flavobacterium sp. J27 TaxID=2060419 RepID=UPI001031A6D5|nr:NAD(P)H-dependent oxidoreductase [Flavobacterium sp. J27]